MTFRCLVSPMTAILLAHATLATPALAQLRCAEGETRPRPDPCLVGNWIGASDAQEVFARFAEGMEGSGVQIDAFPTFPATLGMTVYEDGFYATLPFHETSSVMFTDDTGSSTLTMDLSIPTEAGFFWTSGNQLHNCTIPGGAPMLHAEVQTPDGSGTFTVPVTGEGSYVPVTDYTCAGDRLTTVTHLPVGDVTVNLRRFPDSAFGDTFRDMVDDRFGGPPPAD